MVLVQAVKKKKKTQAIINNKQEEISSIATDIQAKLANSKSTNSRKATKSEKEQAEVENKRRFIKAFRATYSLKEACELSLISRYKVNKWQSEDSKFAEEVSKVTKVITDDLEETAVARAKRGSDVLLMFLLRSLKPERYNDKIATASTGSPPAANPSDWIAAANTLAKQSKEENTANEEINYDEESEEDS